MTEELGPDAGGRRHPWCRTQDKPPGLSEPQVSPLRNGTTGRGKMYVAAWADGDVIVTWSRARAASGASEGVTGVWIMSPYDEDPAPWWLPMALRFGLRLENKTPFLVWLCQLSKVPARGVIPGSEPGTLGLCGLGGYLLLQDFTIVPSFAAPMAPLCR